MWCGAAHVAFSQRPSLQPPSCQNMGAYTQHAASVLPWLKASTSWGLMHREVSSTQVNRSVIQLKPEEHSHCWCQLCRSHTSNEGTVLNKGLLSLSMTSFEFGQYLRPDLEASLSISNLRLRQGEGCADVQNLKFRQRESQDNHSDLLSFEGAYKTVALEEVQNSNRKKAQVITPPWFL